MKLHADNSKAFDDLSRYFTQCSNPSVILNSRGKQILVSCGCCPYCIYRKMQRYTSLCIEESKQNCKTFFITLTYDDENVPVMKLVESVNEFNQPCISGIDVTNRYCHPRLVRKAIRNNKRIDRYNKSTFDTYGCEIHRIYTTLKNKSFRKFLAHVQRESKIFKQRDYEYLYYLKKEDLQKFLKRLRYKISKISDEEVRYFAVGEYGSDTYRPHYHILLFVNDPGIYLRLKDLVISSWEYGITDCEPAISDSGTASYVATYTNSASTIPDVLNSNYIKPFTLHSFSLGRKDIAEIRDFTYRFERYPFEPFDIYTSFGLRKFSLLSKDTSHLFPRCYNYDEQDFPSKSFLYNCYSKLVKQTNISELVKLTKYVLSKPTNRFNYRLLQLLDIIPFRDYEPLCFQENDYDDDDYLVTIYNRVYNALSLSRHFIKFCCEDISPYKMVCKIIDFYKQRDYHFLKKHLEIQEYYCCFCSTTYKHHLDIFYPYNTRKLKYLYKKDLLVNLASMDMNEKIYDRTKHKDLNDKNKIFINIYNYGEEY